MRKNMYTATGAEALLLAAFFYAGTNALVRYMSPMWGDQAQVFARFAIAALILVAINYFRKKQVRNTLRGRVATVVIMSILQAVTILFYTLAVQQTTIANMLFVSYATILITQFLLGIFILREKINKNKIIAIVLSLIGLALYSHSFISAVDIGIVYSMLAGVIGAVVNLLYKKLATIDRGIVLEVQYGIGAILLLALTFAFGGDFIRTVSLEGILITIGYALTILIASYLLLYGYKKVEVSIGGVLSSTELAFGVLIGLILFGEFPYAWELASGVLIAFAACIGAYGQQKEHS